MQSFNKQSILDIWNKKYNLKRFQNTSIVQISSSDYRMGALICPICKQGVAELVRVNRKWACAVCNNASIGKGNGKAASIYRITNDLFEFLGETITLDQLADVQLMNAFVAFSKLKNRPGDYLLFLELLYMIVEINESEHKELDLLNYIGRSKRLIEEHATEEVGV